jgi:hypothetical protein
MLSEDKMNKEKIRLTSRISVEATDRNLITLLFSFEQHYPHLFGPEGKLQSETVMEFLGDFSALLAHVYHYGCPQVPYNELASFEVGDILIKNVEDLIQDFPLHMKDLQFGEFYEATLYRKRPEIFKVLFLDTETGPRLLWRTKEGLLMHLEPNRYHFRIPQIHDHE